MMLFLYNEMEMFKDQNTIYQNESAHSQLNQWYKHFLKRMCVIL